MGRLTKDPELRSTQSGKHVANFTVAVDRDFQKDATDFFQVVAWAETADFVNKYFFKGKMIIVKGSMESRQYTDRNGEKRTAWEVKARTVYFGDDKRRGDAQMDGNTEPQYDTRPKYTQEPGGNPFNDYGREQYGMDDGELPF